MRSNGWLRHSFAQLITLLDIDGIGQNWEGSNIQAKLAYVLFQELRLQTRLAPIWF